MLTIAYDTPHGRLVPRFLTDDAENHAEHDVVGIEISDNRYNLQCSEHKRNIGIFEKE